MKNRRLCQWLLLTLAIIILALIIQFIRYRMYEQANRPAPIKTAVVQHPDVSYLSVSTASYQPTVIAYGSAKAHYQLTLSSQVAGRVNTLTNAFEAGRLISSGSLLAQLEDSSYRASLAAAEQDLSDARLALLEEERQGTQALTEWQASGLSGQPDSELVLRKPQLTAARAAVANAEAALTSARTDLANTSIKAPFDALIVSRSIAPGSYLQSGSEIGTLYSTDRSEIEVELSASAWQKLPEQATLLAGSWPVTLTNVENNQQWQGTVLRSAGHLDATTRKRTLVISVSKPFEQQPALLPQTFVEARIKGQQQAGLWRLPASALSQKGELWYITPANDLASFSAQPSFSDSQYIYIEPPAELAGQPQRVLVHPLSSYIQGMMVHPVEESSHE